MTRRRRAPPPFLFLFALVIPILAEAQSGPNSPPPTSNGYACAANRSLYPCRAFAFYRTAPYSGFYPPLLDLPSIADLFLLPRLALARASNLTASSAPLPPSLPLLVPLSCSCDPATNTSSASIPYTINQNDTFYAVSAYRFANLTSYPAVVAANPSSIPTNLSIGSSVVFPVFCQCLDGNQTSITYSFQPNDTFSALAGQFGTDARSLASLNGPEKNATPYLTVLIPVPSKGIPPPVIKNHSKVTPVPTSPPPTQTIVIKHYRGAVIGLAVGLAVSGVLCVILVVALVRIWRGMKRKKWGNGEVEGGVGEGKMRRRIVERSASDEKLMSDISSWLDKYKVYAVEELEEATAGFDRSRLIQGTVYRGVMDGEVYAIKKMKWNARDELKILQKVNHTNLVKLEGFCIEPDAGACYLVYEFVENGSLSSWLHDPARAQMLDWRTRLRIALDLANGLQYIHEHTWPRVVHKDIKSSNVLLDAKMRAKIANFGLAKTGCNAVTTHIVGTQGYVAPEYLVDGLVTTKMDVFAYGVVLLELVSGKEAVRDDGVVLWMEVEEMFAKKDGRVDGRVLAWMDESIAVEKSSNLESVMNVMSIARACLQRDPAKRPSMVDLAYTLSKSDDMFTDISEDGLMVGGGDVVGR